MCAVFLGVIEGVGIGFQRMMADNTKLEVSVWHLFFHSNIIANEPGDKLADWWRYSSLLHLRLRAERPWLKPLPKISL